MRHAFVERGHRFNFKNASARSPASGMTILVKRQWTSGIKKIMCVNNRVIALDLRIAQKIIRLISVYLLHNGYGRNYFEDIFSDIEPLIIDAMDKGYLIIFGGDFNLSLDRGYRGKVME